METKIQFPERVMIALERLAEERKTTRTEVLIDLVAEKAGLDLKRSA